MISKLGFNVIIDACAAGMQKFHAVSSRRFSKACGLPIFSHFTQHPASRIQDPASSIQYPGTSIQFSGEAAIFS